MNNDTKTKRITKTTIAFENLNNTDTYSLLLFIMFQLRSEPDYLALSELAYILDSDSLTKFLKFYGGLTLKIPTLRDLRLVLQGLSLYQKVAFEQGVFEDCLKEILTDEFSENDLRNMYATIMKVAEQYEFDR